MNFERTGKTTTISSMKYILISQLKSLIDIRQLMVVHIQSTYPNKSANICTYRHRIRKCFGHQARPSNRLTPYRTEGGDPIISSF